MSEYFIQECRVCGRPLRISLHYGGQSVVCQHCRGCFVASDPAGGNNSEASGADDLLRRPGQLLAMAGRVARAQLP